MTTVSQGVEQLIQSIIDEAGDLNPALAAKRIIDQADEAELVNWLRARATFLLAEEVRIRLKRRDPKVHTPSLRGDRDKRRSAFTKAVALGEPAVIEWRQGVFEQRCVVDAQGTERRIADMTREDHAFVARHHQVSAERGAMLAAFHRQIGRALPPGATTSSVMSEAQLTKLANGVLRHG